MAARPDDAHAGRILVLDFGSQYTQLIARRVRETGVYSEIRACDLDAASLAAFGAHGIVLSGGPESAVAGGEGYRVPGAVFESGVPVLGICYGMQAMAAQLGGAVESAAAREFGLAEARIAGGGSELLGGIEDRAGPAGEGGRLDVWMSHGDRVTRLPPGFRAIASSPNAPIAGMADETRRFFGLQFHPEVAHTRQGRAIMQRFVNRICGCPPVWTPANIVADTIAAVRTRVGAARVLLALSGGVDSSVVAALLQRAVGDRLECIFVDHGFLRAGEGDQVVAVLAREMGVEVRRVDAAPRFFAALRGVADPERKRRIIGRLFIDVFEAEAARRPGVSFLAQGTIYPDVIESAGAGTGKAHVIKSHHNVGGLPERMRLALVEPLRELFKDEVRAVGLELGLPHELVFRHPFPGPGLAVRMLGEVDEDGVERLRAADAIFLAELRRAGWHDRVAQAFAVLLPVRSVGVMGDQRRHEPVIALRAVETDDFMTARAARLPWGLLETVATRIVNEVPGVSRVAADVTSKPPATIEWE